MKLFVDHHYYCNNGNYFSNDALCEYDNFTQWYEENKDSDIDMNLIFRWDVKQQYDESIDKLIPNKHSAFIYIMGQRKGLFRIDKIIDFTESDESEFEKHLKKHWQYLKEIWEPISS